MPISIEEMFGGSGGGGGTGTVTNTGALTAGQLIVGNGGVDVSTLAPPLSIALGGTGIASYAVGDILYASGATTLAKLADVAAGSYLRSGGITTAPVWSTATLPNTAVTGDLLYASATSVYSNLADVATGNALISGGVTTAPAWGKIGLTTHVSGTLGVGNGGVGIASYAVGDILYASGATTLSALADVAAGSYLRSGGVTTAPVWSTVTLPNAATTGDLLSVSASNVYANIAAVALGQVLASAGTGTLPAWTASPRLSNILDSGGNPLQAFTATASAVYGLTLTNAALLGTVAIGVTAPTQVTASVAGTPISITAQAAVAGSGTNGAAAGGSITLTSGAAARLVSGVANGGDINLTTGAGIGGGTLGKVITNAVIYSPNGTAGLPSYAFTNATTTGMFFDGASLGLTAAAATAATFNSVSVFANGFTMGTTFANFDVAIKRSAAGLAEIDSSTVGTLRDLKARQFFAGGDNAGLASTTGLTNVTDTTLTNAYTVKGGQAATTANTGWIKIYVGTVVSWIPYWSNATP